MILEVLAMFHARTSPVDMFDEAEGTVQPPQLSENEAEAAASLMQQQPHPIDVVCFHHHISFLFEINYSE